MMTPSRIAPRQRGAWIETLRASQWAVLAAASPLGNGGRGLKRGILAPINREDLHRPSATGGVD